MRIAVTGATGMIGRALVARLEGAGHQVHRLLRDRRGAREWDVLWNPAAGELDPSTLEGIDAAVNLAGERIDERWTDEKKHAIRESRVQATSLLARTMASLATRPKALASVSAIGYYGDRGDEVLDESATRGRGFLAEVVDEWERAASPARDAGIRVAYPRLGIVLSPTGGALHRLVPIFNMGGGGKIGSGRQWMSWVALDDVVTALVFLAGSESLSGPVNVVAPNPVTNADFAHTLGHVLHRPAIAPVPALAVKLMFGEMGEETVLAGQRVIPKKLTEAGFQFRHPTLEGALRFELGK